jgi:uncharacterized protein YnzC (UPF0291/DUF896 family)
MRIPELNRINQLARKARLVPLSEAELAEREVLRKAYLKAVTGQMSNILSTVTVVDYDGRILAQADPGPGEKIVVTEVDIGSLRQARSERLGHNPLAHLRSGAYTARQVDFYPGGTFGTADAREGDRTVEENEQAIRDGIKEGCLPDQDARQSSTCLVGAIAESLVGPLSPAQADTTEQAETNDHDPLVNSIICFCMQGLTGTRR